MSSKLTGANQPFIMPMESVGQEYEQGTVRNPFLCSAVWKSQLDSMAGGWNYLKTCSHRCLVFDPDCQLGLKLQLMVGTSTCWNFSPCGLGFHLPWEQDSNNKCPKKKSETTLPFIT